MQGKKKKSKKVVTKPYLTGSVVDQNTLKNAAGVFGISLMVAVLYLIVGAVLMIDNALLRIIVNAVVLGTVYLIFYYQGLSGSAAEVNQGEMMYSRREKGEEIKPDELARSFHPLKGFVRSFLGLLPFVILSVILAVVTKKQTSGIGVLPSWVAGVTSRQEIGAPLAFYNQVQPFGIEGFSRLITRMNVMPWVNIFDAGNADNMVLMERISPLLVLIPCVMYGIGYLGGVNIRTQIHTDIARSDRRRRKGKKPSAGTGRPLKPKEPLRKPKDPEQLN